MTFITKLPKTIMSTLSSMIWHNLDAKTQWHLIKGSTAIISAAAVRDIARNPKKFMLGTVVVGGIIISILMLFSRK